jgi:hypothetical protein
MAEDAEAAALGFIDALEQAYAHTGAILRLDHLATRMN